MRFLINKSSYQLINWIY